jgi:hypothetical protein
MNVQSQTTAWWTLGVRWLARLLAVGLVLFWGTFFVAHLSWFFTGEGLPPPEVFALQGLHLLLLVGLLAGWRWELAGGLLVLLASLTFFWFAAGSNFVLFAGVTSLPGLLWVGLSEVERRRRAAVTR